MDTIDEVIVKTRIFFKLSPNMTDLAVWKFLMAKLRASHDQFSIRPLPNGRSLLVVNLKHL